MIDNQHNGKSEFKEISHEIRISCLENSNEWRDIQIKCLLFLVISKWIFDYLVN